MRTRGVQGFLEEKAEVPAFALVALCMMARALQFYSGGAIVLAAALGARGVAVFNGFTGFGLAVGTELLMSIAGRQWQANAAEARDVAARRGLNKHERAAMAAHFQSKARWAFAFMIVGLCASITAAFSFLWTANGANHSPTAAISEIAISLLLVSVVFYLGVIKESRGDDPSEIATSRAFQLRAQVVEAAGARIASGTYTDQDVRIVKSALPRSERARFEQALVRDDASDAVWTASQIVAWLGCDDVAGRRRVQRKLARLAEQNAGVIKDEDTRQFRVPRSVVLRHFAEEFIASRTPVTRARQSGPLNPVAAPSDNDSDTTATRARQPHDTPAVVLVPASDRPNDEGRTLGWL